MSTLPLNQDSNPFGSIFRKNPDIFFVLSLFGAVFILVLPIPAGVLDLLFSVSIGCALL
jgi:type III secretory pathway component EscV